MPSWLWCFATAALALAVNPLKPNFDLLDNKAHNATTIKALQGLTKLALKSPNRIIKLNSHLLQRYIFTEYRNFNLLIFGGADSQFCPFCGELKDQYEKLAVDLVNKNGSLPADQFGNPTYLTYFQANVDKQLSVWLDIESVPAIMILRPDNVNYLDAAGRPIKKGRPLNNVAKVQVVDLADQMKRTSTYKFNNMDLAAVIQELAQPAADKPKHSHALSAIPRRMKYILAFALTIIGLAVVFFEAIRSFISRHQTVVAVLALLSFWLSTSGLIYNLQNGFQLFQTDWRNGGKRVYIAPQSRMQYVLEGVGFSMLNCLSLMSCYIAMNLKPALAHWLRPRKALSMRRQIILMTCTVICILIAFFSTRALNWGISRKYGFLKATFFPGPNFERGSLRMNRMYAF